MSHDQRSVVATRWRTSWRGKLILQVLDQRRWFVMFEGWKHSEKWRDARLEDVT